MPEESLSDALARIASQLETVLSEARLAHEAYTRLPRRFDTLTDEILARSTRLELYAADRLVKDLREESAIVARRSPDLTISGARLPLRPGTDDPELVRRWWESLPEPDRERLLFTDPHFVGSTDGLPAHVRHRANLLVLETEITRRQALVAAETDHDAAPDGLLAEQEERDLRGLLKVRALLRPDSLDEDEGAAGPGAREALTKISTPPEERFLYLLDAHSYPLKAVVVLGDLDQADHVVLHVPGATTTVDLRLFRESAWMSNLRAEAGRHVGVEHVAVVDWIGYQAPYDIAVRRPLGDSGVPLFLPGEAADPRYAQEATPSLVRCAEGIRALVGDHARLVGSGHSYGGSVLGLALTRTGAFDAAVVTGCPGLFTTDATDLRLPANAMFAAAAPGDVIALLGVFGGPTHQVAGIRSLSTRARPVSYPDGGRTLLLPVFGHESYYNVGTATLHGIAAVAAGKAEEVRASRTKGVPTHDPVD